MIDTIKQTIFLRFFGLMKIPLLFYLRPTVTQFDDHLCEIKIPLFRHSKNHLNSMYFSALTTGADLAIGLVAMKSILKSRCKVALSFKEFNGKFFKRAESDVYFQCQQVKEIRDLVKKSIQTKKREEMEFTVEALCLSKTVAEFHLLLSLKLKDEECVP